jgi:hypothetical protein
LRIEPVVHSGATATLNLGFLTVLHESNGYLGGYLVTNSWGRPLEFRLSSPVHPNRIQQILYAGTLQSYIGADLIGKTLFEKTGTTAQFILTDRESVLDLRLSVTVPVIWLAPPKDPIAEDLLEDGACVRPPRENAGAILCHPCHPADVAAARALLEQLDRSLDLNEPFGRIREAIAEARKMRGGTL